MPQKAIISTPPYFPSYTLTVSGSVSVPNTAGSTLILPAVLPSATTQRRYLYIGVAGLVSGGNVWISFGQAAVQNGAGSVPLGPPNNSLGYAVAKEYGLVGGFVPQEALYAIADNATPVPLTVWWG